MVGRKEFNAATQLHLRPAKLLSFTAAFSYNHRLLTCGHPWQTFPFSRVSEATALLHHTSNMGSELSRESPRGPVELEAHPMMTEGDLGDQPARKPSTETVEAHSNEGSTSQSAPKQQQQQQEEEACSFSLPAEELGPQELPKNSQETGQPPSCPQGASLDKGHRTNGQTCESEAASSPVEHSDERPPQTQLEAAGKPEAGSGVILFVLSPEVVDLELQVTAENLHCLTESPGQRRPSERSAKEHSSEICNSEDGSFEIIAEGHPEQAAPEMAEGPCDVAERLEAQSSAETESRTAQTAGGGLMRAEVDPLPIAEIEARQGKAHSAVDARIPEGGVGQAASEPPKEADQKSPLAWQALDTLEKPPASNVVGCGAMNADRKLVNGIRNDGGYLTTEAVTLREEQPAAAPRCDPGMEPLLGHLAEPSSKVLGGSDETKGFSLRKEMDATYSVAEAIEMREARVSKLDGRPQMLDGSCALKKMAPVAQEMQPLAETDVHAQVQDSSGAQKDSAEDPAHVRKQQARFRKSFYLCCSQCSVGDGEGNTEP